MVATTFSPMHQSMQFERRRSCATRRMNPTSEPSANRRAIASGNATIVTEVNVTSAVVVHRPSITVARTRAKLTAGTVNFGGADEIV